MNTYKVAVLKSQQVPGFVIVQAESPGHAIEMVSDNLEYELEKTDVRWGEPCYVQRPELDGHSPELIKYVWTNFYKHCGEEWVDAECDSHHNDHCPKCNGEIEPYKSVHNATGEEVDLIGRAALEDARNEVIRGFAKLEHGEEGCIEVDEDAEVSEGEENGAYVQAWVWVDFDRSELSAETKPGDKPAIRIASVDQVCKASGENIFRGQEGFAVPTTLDCGYDWYHKDHIPKEFKV